MPELTKFIFENRLGCLAYEFQSTEEEQQYSQMNTADVIQDIEDSRLEQLYRSVNTTSDCPPSPKKIEFMEARRLSDAMGRTNS